MRTCRVNPGKSGESRFGKWSKFQFSDLLGARLPSGSWLRPVAQHAADHPDHETDAHDDPDLAGREVPGKRSAGLIGPGPEQLRKNAGDLDREADQSYNLTGRASHLPTLQGACNATHQTINSTRINRRVALTPQKDSDVGQFKSLAWFAREQGIGFGLVVEGFGLGVPRELAAHLQGDVPQVAGIGGAVGDLDVTGWQGTRLEAVEKVADMGALAVDSLGRLVLKADLADRPVAVREPDTVGVPPK